MDYQIDIEFWNDGLDNSPIADYLNGLPLKDRGWIIKKNEYFERLTISQLRKSKHLEPVEGTDMLILELKYYSQPPYRMLCVIWKQKLIGLVMFQGSGTRGISRYKTQAIERADHWKRSH